MKLTFHHVGVGTTEFDKTVETYIALGHRLYCSVDDPLLNVRVAFLASPGDLSLWIEVLAPLGVNGPLQSLIARNLLPSPYHTCYSVPQLGEAGEELLLRGFLPIGEPRAALAFNGARVAFFYHPAIGLMELVESPPF